MALGNLIKNAAGDDKPRYKLSDDITFRFVCSSYSLEVSDRLSYATLHIPHDHIVGGRSVRYDLRESLLQCLNSKPAKVYDMSAYEVRRKWFADRGSFRQVDYDMIIDPWGKWIPWYRTSRQAVSGRLVKCQDGTFIEIQVFTTNNYSAIAKSVILIPINVVGGFLAYVDISWKEEGLCRYGV